MALTFLGLTNSLLERLNEVPLTSTNFSSAVGFAKHAKNAVNATINDIHSKEREWPFNYQQQTFVTVVTTDPEADVIYTIPSTVLSINWNTFFIDRDDTLTPKVQTTALIYKDYTEYAQQQRPIDFQVNTPERVQPRVVSRSPNNSIILSGVPDRVYTVKYDAYIKPVALSAYTDTTTIPDMYEDLILDGASMYAYMFRENQEGAMIWQSQYKTKLDNMRQSLIPAEYAFRSTQTQFTRVGVANTIIASLP